MPCRCCNTSGSCEEDGDCAPGYYCCDGTCTDEPCPAAYTVVPSVTSVDEGGTVTFNVTTDNVANGTTLYWTIQNTGSANPTENADFSATSGSFTITDDAGLFAVTLVNDSTTEGLETFRAQVRTGSTSGTVVATSANVAVNDTSQGVTYSLSANRSELVENGVGFRSVTFTVTTTNVPDGTVLYYTLSGTATAADFIGGAMSGSVTITNNTGLFLRGTVEDGLAEGTESFTASLRTGSISGPIVATAGPISILDTSNAPSYTFYSQPNPINEGVTATYRLRTIGVASGTVLHWSIEAVSAGLTSNDFTSGMSGTMTVNASENANFTVSTRNDVTTEGTEQFRIRVRTGSQSGPIVATSNTINITDSSKAPPTYSLTPSATLVFEGQAVTFTVNTTSVTSGTILYWRWLSYTTGGVTSAVVGDFSGAPAANTPTGISINNNTATFSLAVREDSLTEGEEYFSVVLQTRSSSGVYTTVASVQPIIIAASGACGQLSTSGGAGVTERSVNTVSGAVTMTLTYQAFTIADRFRVRSLTGTQYIDTGFVSGTGTVSFCKPSGITTLIVRVDGPEGGTEWQYTLACGSTCNPLP